MNIKKLNILEVVTPYNREVRHSWRFKLEYTCSFRSKDFHIQYYRWEIEFIESI